MLFHILKIVTLFSVCAGLYLDKMQQLPSNYAFSSQSFRREDIPLAYKFNSVHIYTTPTPMYSMHEPHANIYHKPPVPLDSMKFRNIQYAPLGLDPSTLYSKMYVPKAHQHQLSATTLRRDHLEPRIVTSNPEKPSHMEYIPGHNIAVMQSVNRIPGHNAVYKSYPDQSVINEKQNKINHLRQYLLYQNQRQLDAITQNVREVVTTPPTTTTIMSTESPISTEANLLPIQQYIPKLNLYNGGGILTHIANEEKQQPHKLPYTKMHALFLNVARTYNFMPQRGPIQNTDLVVNTPSHTQALIRVPGSSKLEAIQPDKKTLVFPIQKNRHFSIQS